MTHPDRSEGGRRARREPWLRLAMFAALLIVIIIFKTRVSDWLEAGRGVTRALLEGPAVTAASSTSLPGYPAGSVMDGRTSGATPYSWRPAPGATAEIVLAWSGKVALAGLTVEWDGGPPARLTLVGEGPTAMLDVSPLTGNRQEIRLAPPWNTTRLTLLMEPRPPFTGIAEIVPTLAKDQARR
ncbi:MAG: hypothetical protein PHU25_12110 [Deltaproteobacteria bacterium]|nr:hypothetical protein [Deltaproteobacteria bacterium]